MNEYMDVHFPDRDHLKKFPDDAYEAPVDVRYRFGLPRGVRPGVYLVGLALGIVVGALVILLSCSTEKRDRELEMKVLQRQHAGLSEAMREFDVKTPDVKTPVTTAPKPAPKTESRKGKR